MSGKSLAGVARLMAVAAVVTAAGAAHAAKYTGTWDPVFGPQFGTMGWRGQATFELTGDCLLTGSGTVTSTCLGAASTATVLQAIVEFYDDAASGKPTLATLSWTNPVVSFKSASFVDGVLSSFASDFLDKAVDGKMFSIPGEYSFGAGAANPEDFEFYLEFLGTDARMAYLRHLGKPGEAAPESPNCANENNPQPMCGYSSPDQDARANGTLMRFARADGGVVPEPATLALMASGIVAIGFMARRRRRT